MERIVRAAREHAHQVARKPGDLGELGERANIVVDALVGTGLDLAEAADQRWKGRVRCHEGIISENPK
jgi:hypothetical protein